MRASGKEEKMDMFRTGIITGVAATGLAVGGLLSGAGAAHADDHSYLNDLRGVGVFIHKDAEPYVVQQGHRACRDLHDGVPPDEVEAQFSVGSGVAPAPAPAVYLDILQRDLCPWALS